MSSLPVNRDRRRSSDFGNDFELFDPWRDSKSNTFASLRWINRPKRRQEYEEIVAPALESQPYGDKYRVKLDISGYDPESIQTTIEGRLLLIEAKQNGQSEKERKMYDLPEPVYEHADADHLVSYVTPNNLLIVDIPLHNHEHKQRYLESATDADHQHLLPYGQNREQSFDYHHFHTSSFTPKVVNGEEKKKKLEMSLPMKNYRPDQIKVSVRNNDLIVQGEHMSLTDRTLEKSYFYRSITLPPGTQTDHLQSYLTDDGHLTIEVPYTEHSQNK
ncbi:unnamed protein product [Adineta ricciae]|uniref:SHSP domain-containing protein n=1 Tax=Adineta ricciae TaxID=249248 RepID=A0A815N209_ADIRI|nr:unnamed protein product [Adineta ricciae]CAF1573842.1 unnamed protein product [Adineta ricciae]